jgi:hypothetical protein
MSPTARLFNFIEKKKQGKKEGNLKGNGDPVTFIEKGPEYLNHLFLSFFLLLARPWAERPR